MFIYKHYDQAALDLQYNNRLQVPQHPQHVANWETWSKEAEQKYKPVKDIAYGDHTRERLDIYPSSRPFSKTLVFIHGGYWRNLDKSMFQFVAGAFHDYDLGIIIITYPLSPVVNMDQVVLSCRKAIDWVYKNIQQYNGDPEQIFIAGHSAGGHLAAMMMTGDPNFSIVPLKGVCPMSGLFNLTPIRLCEVNQTLQMDEAMALRNSPVYLLPVVSCPLLLTMGADETQEYQDQSGELYENWKDKIPVQLFSLKGLNHYTIVGDLLNKQSFLHQEMRKLMNL